MPSIINIEIKDFILFKTPEDFFSIMNDMEEKKSENKFKDDGYIFTPTNMKYNSGNDKILSLNERKLTEYPDICKWKPIEFMTIDFAIFRESGKIKLFSYHKREYILFKGSNIEPFDIEDVDSENELTKDIPDKTVVEYKWSNNKFVPIRIRKDKEKPNLVEFANDNWKLIKNPILISTFKGDDIVLLRRYHNSIKKKLFLSRKKDSTLIDIGSGRGGDVIKWKLSKFSKIIAVEPNDEYIKELVKRIKSIFSIDNIPIIENIEDLNENIKNFPIIIVKTYGEDYELIRKVRELYIGEKVDTISMMLSLSFFWNKEENFNNLMKTIKSNLKEDGEFIFLSIDGDSVKEAFKPKFNKNSIFEINLEKIGNIRLSGEKVFISFEGTIVENQEEYLVNFDDIRLTTIELKEINISDKELFLNNYEKKITTLYSYGSFKNFIEKDINKMVSAIEVFIKENIAVNDDIFKFVKNSTKFNMPIIRIASIPENSLIHSILKAFYKKYANYLNYENRTIIVNKFIEGLSEILDIPNVDFTGKKYYQEIENKSISEIIKLLKENDDEIIPLISQVIRININVFLILEDDLLINKKSSKFPISINIGKNSIGYELLGLNTGFGIKTVFLLKENFF